MNCALLIGSTLILLTGCAADPVRRGHKTIYATAPCLAEVKETENGNCFQVVRLSGDCSSSDAVDAEQLWLTQHYPGWDLLSHALTSSVRGQPSQVEDHLRIRTEEGKELGFCFDITAFW